MSNQKYSLGEEISNSITHGIGALLSVAGCVIAIVWAALYSSPWGVVSACIYGASLIMLYSMSTMYHALTNKKAKAVFQILDHTSIFFLIAGSYTPITLVLIRSWVGFTIFGIVWGATILGIVLNSISIERFKKFSMICYLATGWAVLLGIKPVIENLHKNGLILLILGGLCYTLGVIFYKLKSVKYMHSVWHFFVLGGSILHYFCFLFYVFTLK